jgi:hypothetical protein
MQYFYYPQNTAGFALKIENIFRGNMNLIINKNNPVVFFFMCGTELYVTGLNFTAAFRNI